jgi:hypothetical protein
MSAAMSRCHGLVINHFERSLDFVAFRAPPVRMATRFAMDQFIERQNIAHYTELLMTEIDPLKRELLHRLLAEEMVKQTSHANVGQ